MTNKEAIEIISRYEVNGCGYCHQGGDEIPEAFNMAIKALKAQEPRVMTLEEVKANRLEPIWLETQDDSYFEWALWRAYDDEDMMRFFWGDDGESWRINVPPEEYGKTWRCWTSRPTDEQMEAVKWE